MSEKTNKAVAKITDEMMKLNNPLAQYIEEHLTKKCVNDAIADKLLTEGKSLKELTGKIRAKAQKDSANGVGCVSDTDVTEMAEEYYGISSGTAGGTNVIDVLDYL